MGTEIERKFLLKDDSWKAHVIATHEIAQGYLSRDADRTVRIRQKDDLAFITIKGAPADKTPGAPIMVPEFEYAIPPADAAALLGMCLPGSIQKTRHIVQHDGHTWEIDVFHGDNDGLIMAEIELKSADETFTAPPWLGAEVSHDKRYANGRLAEKPFRTWGQTPPRPPGP